MTIYIYIGVWKQIIWIQPIMVPRDHLLFGSNRDAPMTLAMPIFGSLNTDGKISFQWLPSNK